MSLKVSATNKIQIQNPQLTLNLLLRKAGGRGPSLTSIRRGRPKPPSPSAWFSTPARTSPIMPEAASPTGAIFIAAATIVRPMLGVSPSAFEDAQQAMGERQAAIVLAAILQRGPAIASPGGYLRDLTQKAKAGAFSPGPMLMALIGNRKKERAEKEGVRRKRAGGGHACGDAACAFQ